jgi:hypothetical protein
MNIETFKEVVSKTNILIENIKNAVKKPELVCICGSSKFCDLIAVVKWMIEKQNIMATGLHLLPSWYTERMSWKENHHGAENENVAKEMDDIHLRKINKSDCVVVVNPGNYIGDRTKFEIEYSISKNKPILYWETK